MGLEPSVDEKRLNYETIATGILQNKHQVTWELWEAYPDEEDKKALFRMFLEDVIDKARKQNQIIVYYERTLIMTDDEEAVMKALSDYRKEHKRKHPYAFELSHGVQWRIHYCIIKAYVRSLDHTHITIP